MASTGRRSGKAETLSASHHPPAHGEHVAAGVGGGDGPEVGRVVDEGREEVGGRHQRQVVADPVDGGVVERGQAHQQRVVRAWPPAPGRGRTSGAAPHFAAQPPHDVHSVSRSVEVAGVVAAGSWTPSLEAWHDARPGRRR